MRVVITFCDRNFFLSWLLGACSVVGTCFRWEVVETSLWAWVVCVHSFGPVGCLGGPCLWGVAHEPGGAFPGPLSLCVSVSLRLVLVWWAQRHRDHRGTDTTLGIDSKSDLGSLRSQWSALIAKSMECPSLMTRSLSQRLGKITNSWGNCWVDQHCMAFSCSCPRIPKEKNAGGLESRLCAFENKTNEN